MYTPLWKAFPPHSTRLRQGLRKCGVRRSSSSSAIVRPGRACPRTLPPSSSSNTSVSVCPGRGCFHVSRDCRCALLPLCFFDLLTWIQIYCRITTYSRSLLCQLNSAFGFDYHAGNLVCRASAMPSTRRYARCRAEAFIALSPSRSKQSACSGTTWAFCQVCSVTHPVPDLRRQNSGRCRFLIPGWFRSDFAFDLLDVPLPFVRSSIFIHLLTSDRFFMSRAAIRMCAWVNTIPSKTLGK
ncbi:hypothetical protein OF83DRAFT_1153060 [Amylostereum chailletii]|nr:hypothetical protein OF83DRAFT_1153060 [Amylostereum chailletii]